MFRVEGVLYSLTSSTVQLLIDRACRCWTLPEHTADCCTAYSTYAWYSLTDWLHLAFASCLLWCGCVQEEAVYDTPFNDKNPRRTMKVRGGGAPLNNLAAVTL